MCVPRRIRLLSFALLSLKSHIVNSVDSTLEFLSSTRRNDNGIVLSLHTYNCFACCIAHLEQAFKMDGCDAIKSTILEQLFILFELMQQVRNKILDRGIDLARINFVLLSIVTLRTFLRPIDSLWGNVGQNNYDEASGFIVVLVFFSIFDSLILTVSLYCIAKCDKSTVTPRASCPLMCLWSSSMDLHYWNLLCISPTAIFSI